MPSLQTSARIALGKFFFHPWDSQVLVDWAACQVQDGASNSELLRLSRMQGADRHAILRQFFAAAEASGLTVETDETAAAMAYLRDLRQRVLNGAIDPPAAFAQVRHLAYDVDAPHLDGLAELDEDLNLLDSQQTPWHNPNLTAENRNDHIRAFFRHLGPLIANPRFWRRGPAVRQLYSDLDYRLVRWLEAIALAVIFSLIVLYLLLAVARMKGF